MCARLNASVPFSLSVTVCTDEEKPIVNSEEFPGISPVYVLILFTVVKINWNCNAKCLCFTERKTPT